MPSASLRLVGGVLATLVALGACSSGSDNPHPPPDSGTPDAGPDAGPPLPPLPVGVLVGSRGTDKVLRYDGSGASQGVFAADPLLVKPVGITYGPDGNVYVAAGDTDHVVRFNGTTGAAMGVFTHGATIQSPRNVNFGPDGAFYVADGFLNQVIRFDGGTGDLDRIFISDPALQGPTSFTFGPDGQVYVVSVLSNRVLKFDGSTGALIGTFASTGLDQPHDVSFGPDGNLYVTNSGNTVIQRFHADTGAPMGPFVSDPGLINPLGMAWGPDGNLYVVNRGADGVRRYDGVTGARLPDFIAPGAGGLVSPAFLVFVPPAALSLQAVSDVARTWAAVVVSGARPGAKVVLVRGTPGGSGTLADCPALALPLDTPTVSAVRMADESGSGVVSVQGTSGSSQSFVAVDTSRCLATAVTTVTVP
jgi:streptogramin lyase